MDFRNLSDNRHSCLNLTKGSVLDLSKSAPHLRKAALCGGWDMVAVGPSADLDLAAFLLNDQGRISSGDNVIFFNHMSAPGISLDGDNRTGAGDGDDERISIDLDSIDRNVSDIVFAITIYDGVNKKQTFGMIKNAYVRLVDSDNDDKEVCRYPLTDLYASDTALVACRLHRNSTGWEFEAIGDGLIGDLNTIADRYM